MNVRRSCVRRTGLPPHGPWLAGALLTLVAAGSTPLAAQGSYDEGQRIQIKGMVTNEIGSPQRGRTVLLEAYRKAFDLRSLNPRARGEKKGLVQRTATSLSDGSYALEWPWHDYYNRFELSVGEFGPDGFEATERIDISRRILRGSPVIVSFVLSEPGQPTASATPPATAPTVGSSPAPTAAPLTYDERDRVRSREGEPDLVDTLELPYGVEVTWWYFERGRAYRFLDGELRDEMAFSPVSGGA